MLMAFPTRTHIYGIAPIGWALRAAGHEVRFVVQHNPAEVEPLLETGLDTMWFGDDFDLARHRRAARGLDSEGGMDSAYKISESRPENYTDDYIRTVYEMWSWALRWAAPDSFLNDVLPFARRWQPDLVIWDPIIYAGPLIAHAVGAANMRMLIAADQTARIACQYREMMRRLDPSGAVEDPLVAWMSQWLDGQGRGCDGRRFEEELRFGMASIDPGPACIRYDLDVNYIPVRFAPVNRPMTMPDWLLREPPRPRVCVTLGVSARQVHGREETSVASLLDGLADLDVEVVATLNADQLADVPRLPDNVRAVDFVPLNELLATCSAIVHQGGGATLGNAVVNGVPQLIIPGTTWAERVSAMAQERRGYGLFLELEQVTAEAVRERVSRLLHEPSFRDSAVAVQREMLQTPTMLDIVPDLELAAARHRAG
jgi:UDP:flavonoid glycosyltransferase YjiC (YdhE family)